VFVSGVLTDDDDDGATDTAGTERGDVLLLTGQYAAEH